MSIVWCLWCGVYSAVSIVRCLWCGVYSAVSVVLECRFLLAGCFQVDVFTTAVVLVMAVQDKACRYTLVVLLLCWTPAQGKRRDSDGSER